MKKNIYITSLLCGWMAFATTSCEDPGEVHFDDDSFSSTLYLKDNGLQEVDFYNVNKDLIFSTIVGKAAQTTTLHALPQYACLHRKKWMPITN